MLRHVHRKLHHGILFDRRLSHCQITSMGTARFRPPNEEEIFLLSETVPKYTKYNTKWAVNVITAWQNTRMNKKAQLETSGGNGLE